MAVETGAAIIATAHTADDQAETVLLRLLRGSGPDGLAGIPERSRDGRIARPLLAVTRAEIERFATARGLVWREDASNASGAYARNRLRNDWLPGLARAFNPGLLRALASLAEAQRKDSEWIGSHVEREALRRFAIEQGWLRIETAGWSELPEALARRLAREALASCGSGRLASRRHLERMDAFLRRGAAHRTLELPGGLSLVRDRSGVRLGPIRDGSPAASRSRMLNCRATVGFPPRGVH
jgi:tRNA(Ile)-lysidine synthase